MEVKSYHKALTYANAYDFIIKEFSFVKVRQEYDCFFLISFKNDRLYHKRLQNPKIFQTHLTNEGLIISASLFHC